MPTENICPNCGSPNHHFSIKCMFCETPIEKVSDKSISSEDLMSSIGLWFGRLKESGGVSVTIQSEGREIDYSFEDAKGIANQYLSVLRLRTINQPELREIYNDFKNEFDVKIPEYLKQKDRSDWKIIIIVFVVLGGIAALALWAKNKGWF
ncbi:MAG: hypothetical protein WCK02_14645 [Bacteroidota bacterium]